MAVLLALEAQAVDRASTQPGSPAARPPGRLEELLDLVHLALALAEQDLLARGNAWPEARQSSP